MRCSICSHPRREAIEDLAHGKKDALAVAYAYEISEAALKRHLAKHVTGKRAKPAPSPRAKKRALAGAKRTGKRPCRAALALAPPPVVEEEEAPLTPRCPVSPKASPPPSGQVVGASAKEQLLDVVRRIRALIDDVEGSAFATYKDKAAVYRSLTPNIRLLGQLTGELGASESLVSASPHFRRIVGAMLEALSPFPDAQRAVLARLEQVEAA